MWRFLWRRRHLSRQRFGLQFRRGGGRLTGWNTRRECILAGRTFDRLAQQLLRDTELAPAISAINHNRWHDSPTVLRMASETKPMRMKTPPHGAAGSTTTAKGPEAGPDNSANPSRGSQAFPFTIHSATANLA